MTPSDIADALTDIAASPFDPREFAFAFAEATDNAPGTVSKLRGGSYNRSDLQDGVLLNGKFHFAPAAPGFLEATFDALRGSKRTAKHRPAVLITCDGEMVSALSPATGETRHFPWAELGDHFGFFLPAAGKERYRAAEENPVDVKVAGKLARLYDALTRNNPDWATEARRHDMNQLMTRLIFCMFAEDVGIFPDDQFSRLIFTHAGNRGEDLDTVLHQAFTAMNRQADHRDDLPAWTHEISYVNGGLFAGPVEVPVFDAAASRYLRDACAEDWREINPDIFGSMIQSVANADLRSDLGMHYTSVPNIMKVLGPLFLDDIDAQIEKAWSRSKALRAVMDRISKIRVFDPACGSGNFLVVAYRELREREIRILTRIAEITGGPQKELFSLTSISNFYGIDLTDFGAETAKLALFIAEYQANAQMYEVFGAKPADLPLREAANIVCDNALRVDWEAVCPPPEEGHEVFIAGNPPFYGKAQQEVDHKADKDFLFSGVTKKYKAFDYVVGWFYKASRYLQARNVRAAFVSTNSLVQGDAASTVWPLVLGSEREIFFGHRTFKWRNNASANAAVMCVIVGIRNKSGAPKTLIDGDLHSWASNINAYLLDGPDTTVTRQSASLFGLPDMQFGNMPYDAGYLLMNRDERDRLLHDYPEAEPFIRRFVGSQELIRGIERFCLWIDDDRLEDAMAIPGIARKVEATRLARLDMKDAAGKTLADRPHQFREHYAPCKHAFLVPGVSSERRSYLPIARVDADTIASNLNFALYDAPDWCMALIASRLHLAWIGTVCGRLESRFRYSNTLGWNTFPVPKFTDDQLETLTASAMDILRCRYGHHPATIAELYDPDKMPEDLRAAHKANDDLLESMYIGRPFRNDTERLEHLFKLYAARIRRIEKNGNSKKGRVHA